MKDPAGKGDVLAIGPGTVVAARLAAGDPPLPEGDPCFVLVRHLLARDTKALVDPKELAESKKAVGVTPFFALYMHLAPITRYLGPPKDGDEVPPLAARGAELARGPLAPPTPRDTDPRRHAPGRPRAEGRRSGTRAGSRSGPIRG